ncbi:S9 family peptidase [Cupriavidus plantarum]|uniref:S9 family peptidase n=1 Tax=Cupriavidus plantarum TaxID=942865 RepID=UPI0015CC6A46|nr:S9 family peptidase [Cupriavidus plantarum]NYI00099.1 dipeptidyl aminopeptidase/acylaminoacyl peptidase [Cupriavidus plantarum]
MSHAHISPVTPPATALAEIPLIPRVELFGNPVRAGARISPDGRYLSWSAPEAGVMNLWVAPRDNPARARVLTHDRVRGVYTSWWSYDGAHLLYVQDVGGDENYHVYAVSPTGGEARDLTPFPGVRASVAALSHKPALRGKALLSLNHRDARYHDLYLADIATGDLTLLQENPGYAGFLTDDDFRVLLAVETLDDGGARYLKPTPEGWQPWLSVSADDARTTHASHVDVTGTTLYLYDSRGRDTAALVSIPLAAESGDTAVPTVIAEDARADIGGALLDAFTYEPLAYSVEHERRAFVVLAERLREDVALLDSKLGGADGEWGLASRSEDDRYWIIGAASDRVPGAAWLFDRQTRTLERLYVTRPTLLDHKLARMQSTTIRSRDGLDLVTYVTIPVHADASLGEGGQPLTSHAPVPTVLLVHGGPWARDSFGFNPLDQWLANRGYAVLSVNFRGSTGFGKRFLSASDLEWGAKMDDDLSDAVDWAIAQGIADPKRVAIMGWSYGGYATLWAMTRHADRYACGVDVVGPSNLETLLASIPPYWESFRATLYRAVGNPDTEAGKALLKERSPLSHASRIAKPLLIGQGANDPRVKEAESTQMIDALRAKGIPFTYVVFPDEGHGFLRPANSIRFNTIIETFLATHLGGRAEPSHPAEIEGNTAVIESVEKY